MVPVHTAALSVLWLHEVGTSTATSGVNGGGIVCATLAKTFIRHKPNMEEGEIRKRDPDRQVSILHRLPLPLVHSKFSSFLVHFIFLFNPS